MTPGRTPLQPFIAPDSIAVFGASPHAGTLGHALVGNLFGSACAAQLHLISDRHREINGMPCHPSLEAVGAPVTLALIATPAATVPAIIESCARHRVKAAVIYSAGLREADALAGSRLVEHIGATAAGAGMRLYGPGALGYALPHADLNVMPMRLAVPAGNLALVSQSAAVCANILDWSHSASGFSAIFSPGESADIELPEILDYLACDPKTESILLYLEGLRDARGFLSAVRTAASVKPVIALKAGNRPLSSRLAEAHSGAPAGDDDAFDAALRRAGVLRVQSIGDMFSAARALTTPRKPRGNRLAIVANGGGPAVMAADRAAELDIALADLSPETCARLAVLLPPTWSAGNPVDVGFDADGERFVGAIAACLDDPGVDGVLAVFAPNTYVDPLGVAQATIRLHDADKPVLSCWLGERQVHAARAAFDQARFPTFRTPENAVVAFAFMVNWVRNQALLKETPPALSSYLAPDAPTARSVIEAALAAGRDRLTLAEAKAVLAAFHIPVSPTLPAANLADAVAIANRLGYPVVMKPDLPSPSGKHARLHLRSAPEVALAYRDLTAPPGDHAVIVEPYIEKPQGRALSIAIRPDRLFGPIITLAEGGIAAEIYDARSVGLPPLNPRLVGEMISLPCVARLLGPLRDRPAVDDAPLRAILLRVSELASELPWVRSLDIASLIADQNGAVAVDVRIEIQPLPEERDRYGHMAICPYPAQLVGEWRLKDGSRCVIRPIRPEDATMLQDFVRGLSPRTKRFRYFAAVSELPQNDLARYTQIDYGRQLTLVAITEDDGIAAMRGEAHYSTMLDGKTAEFAIVIDDAMAGRGLAKRLTECLIEAARENGLSALRGEVMADNEAMVGLAEALDFSVNLTDEENLVEITRRL